MFMDLIEDYRYKVWLWYRIYFWMHKHLDEIERHHNDYIRYVNDQIEIYNRIQKEFEAYKKRVLES